MSTFLYSIISSVLLCVFCWAGQSNVSNEAAIIRKTFDSIQIRKPEYHNYNYTDIIRVKSQREWDGISNEIQTRLHAGAKNVLVSIEANSLFYGETLNKLEHIKDEDANLKFLGNNTLMIPAGEVYERRNAVKTKNLSHWDLPCESFVMNNMVYDNKSRPLSLYDNVFFVDSQIESVDELGYEDILDKKGRLYKKIKKNWRFRTSLDNLKENECDDFYILLTRNWTSCRHKVLKVEDGYLYFYLKSEDAESLYQMCMDPNVDLETYGVKPRCKYFNRPYRDGIYFIKGRIFVPSNISSVRVCNNSQFFVVSDCNMNSLEISGFRVLGSCGYSSIYVPNTHFKDQMWIRYNQFMNMPSSAINVENSENVCVYNNNISNTRVNAIRCKGKQLTIWKNRLKNIGYMSQTVAISFTGKDIYVCENEIEDFYYSAIGTGSTASNSHSDPLTYIVERNIISYTPSFIKDYIGHTIADGGGIYVGPQNKRGIIRYNIINGVRGAGDNRGLFLDDGAKNLTIYGNLIMNTDNSYDIDLRRCKTYADGIPDHNTNNQIFHNIMTGGYRFQDIGKDDNRCIGGENLLLDIGDFQKKVVELKCSTPDYTIEGGKYKNGKVIIPKGYRGLLDSLRIDSFVRKYIFLR